MTPKGCFSCIHWSPPVNHLGHKKTEPGTWGECKLISQATPANNAHAYIFTPFRSNVETRSISLQTRAEFYCEHHEEVKLPPTTGQ